MPYDGLHEMVYFQMGGYAEMQKEKRLTEKHYDGKGYYMKCSGVCHFDGHCANCDELVKLVDRLGEYEDKAEQTVDAVEVVRCKDCNGWCRNVGFVDSPNGHCFTHDIDTNGYDYCSYGERKDNVE